MSVINGLPFPLTDHPASGDFPHLDKLVGQIFDAGSPGAKSGDHYMLVRVNGSLSLLASTAGQTLLRWNTEVNFDVSVTTATADQLIAGICPEGIDSANTPSDNDLILMQVNGICEAPADSATTPAAGTIYGNSSAVAGTLEAAGEAGAGIDNQGGLLFRGIDAGSASTAFTARIVNGY